MVLLVQRFLYHMLIVTTTGSSTSIRLTNVEAYAMSSGIYGSAE